MAVGQKFGALDPGRLTSAYSVHFFVVKQGHQILTHRHLLPKATFHHKLCATRLFMRNHIRPAAATKASQFGPKRLEKLLAQAL